MVFHVLLPLFSLIVGPGNPRLTDITVLFRSKGKKRGKKKRESKKRGRGRCKNNTDSKTRGREKTRMNDGSHSLQRRTSTRKTWLTRIPSYFLTPDVFSRRRWRRSKDRFCFICSCDGDSFGARKESHSLPVLLAVDNNLSQTAQQAATDCVSIELPHN